MQLQILKKDQDESVLAGNSILFQWSNSRDSLQIKRHTYTELKVRKNMSYANTNEKKAGVAIFMPHKVDFNPKTVKRDKEEFT